MIANEKSKLLFPFKSFFFDCLLKSEIEKVIDTSFNKISISYFDKLNIKDNRSNLKLYIKEKYKKKYIHSTKIQNDTTIK